MGLAVPGVGGIPWPAARLFVGVLAVDLGRPRGFSLRLMRQAIEHVALVVLWLKIPGVLLCGMAGIPVNLSCLTALENTLVHQRLLCGGLTAP